MSMIELRRVSKDYNGRRVINDVSLKAESGERVVLFGPSGCGKSTVLALIAGLVIPSRTNAESEWCFRISRFGLI